MEEKKPENKKKKNGVSWLVIAGAGLLLVAGVILIIIGLPKGSGGDTSSSVDPTSSLNSSVPPQSGSTDPISTSSEIPPFDYGPSIEALNDIKENGFKTGQEAYPGNFSFSAELNTKPDVTSWSAEYVKDPVHLVYTKQIGDWVAVDTFYKAAHTLMQHHVDPTTPPEGYDDNVPYEKINEFLDPCYEAYDECFSQIDEEISILRTIDDETVLPNITIGEPGNISISLMGDNINKATDEDNKLMILNIVYKDYRLTALYRLYANGNWYRYSFNDYVPPVEE